MPRRSKREQTPAAPQDQGYGVRGEQIASQNQMPLPNNRDAGAPAPTPGPAGPSLGQPAPAGPANPQDLLAMLQQMPPPPPGGLARPSERPEEGITQGLGQASPAPRRNVAAETFDAMAEATGDERFRRLAQRARSI